MHVVISRLITNRIVNEQVTNDSLREEKNRMIKIQKKVREKMKHKRGGTNR